MECYSGINKIKVVPFADTWRDLEPVIQSKVSQKEKNKYINAYVWNLEKWY